MPHHASPTMGPKEGSVRSWATWVRVCIGVWVVCCAPVGALATAIPKGLTTEGYIYTGPTTAPTTTEPPPREFEVNYKEAYATFVNLTVSYNASLEINKIIIFFEDTYDHTKNTITLDISDNGIDATNTFDPAEGRLGFRYKLGGLRKRRRYVVRFTAFIDNEEYTSIVLNFISGNNDGEDSIYNLTGIFLVLGISTIIMVVVMVCVGYEKLIHNKSEECCAFILCQRKKKKIPKASISPEPLMVNDGRGFDESSSDSNHRY